MVLGVGGLKGTQIIKVQSSLRDRKLSSVLPQTIPVEQ